MFSVHVLTGQSSLGELAQHEAGNYNVMAVLWVKAYCIITLFYAALKSILDKHMHQHERAHA